MHRSNVQEYVVNPRSNRLILKGGLTHRRWRKANPDAPTLPVVYRGPRDATADPARPSSFKTTAIPLHSTCEEKQQLNTGFPATVASIQDAEDGGHLGNSSVTSEAACNETPAALNQHPRAVAEQHPETVPSIDDEPRNMSDDLDPEVWMDEILDTHGEALLKAYSDPSVDFLEAAAKLIGLADTSP